jgi:hypothetical protein
MLSPYLGLRSGLNLGLILGLGLRLGLIFGLDPGLGVVFGLGLSFCLGLNKGEAK